METALLIAVIGHTGMVGSTIFEYYKSKDYHVIGSSLDNKTSDYDDLLPQADYIFVAVPTPYNWETQEYNMSIVEDVLTYLQDNSQGSARVILKSTMTPGTTDRLQSKYDLNLLFNPEFLSEATATEDFLNPDRQIVGYTERSLKYATEVLHLLPNSPYDVLVTAKEAEIIKYVNNFHGALMVIFANFIYDVSEKLGADFEVVKRAAQASKWVGSPMGRMYWGVMHGGYRGYGGPCFPKDMNNLLSWSKEQGLKCEILDAMVQANQRLLSEQGLTEQEVEKFTNRKV